MSISELSAQLDKAVADVSSKLEAKEKAEKAASMASNSYIESLNRARDLREKLNTELDKLMGVSQARVR